MWNTGTLLATGAGAAFFIVVNVVTDVIVPPAVPFMEVDSMTFRDGRVYVQSQINVDYVIADWQVAVVSTESDKPSCSTKKGPKIHEGWSPYTEREMSGIDFTLDVWVNDVGCLERLQASGYNEYKMFVTWTPRDGSRPVIAKTEFNLDG